MLNIPSSAIGFLTNPEKLRNTFRTVKKFKITANTIHKYLAYFEDSLDVVSPYYDEYGILTVNIHDFLLKPGCLEREFWSGIAGL